MNKADLIAIRDFKAEDWNLILATILRGLYYGSESWWREIPKEIFMERYHKFLEALLSSPNTEIKVAYLKGDEDVVVGYAVTSVDHETLHYVFVKAAWRGIGIAKSLLPKETKQVTHITKTGLGILKKKLPGVIFNPFAVT